MQLRDDQPSISSASVNVDYDVSFDTNFVDRIAFASGVSKYCEEAQNHGVLVRVNRSCAFISNSISRCKPANVIFV